MKFKDAYIKMLEGYKIARPGFKGFWYIDSVTGKTIIHLANNTEITEGDLSLTIQSTLAEDWEVVKPVKVDTLDKKVHKLLKG